MLTNQITLGFYLFIFSLYLFLSSFLFGAVFGFLQGFFQVEEFLRERKGGKHCLPWTSQGWKKKSCSEFFSKILKCLGAYFKLHQFNHAGLRIVGKVLLCFAI